MKQLQPSGKLSVGSNKRNPVIWIVLSSLIFVAAGSFFFISTAVEGDVPDVNLPDSALFNFIPFSCLAPILIIGLIVGGIVIYQVGFRAARQARLDVPALSISDDSLRVGEKFSVVYEQKVSGQAVIRNMKFQLVLRERARYRSGTDTITVYHDHIIDQLTVPGGIQSPGSTIYQSFDWQIPPAGMHTFGVVVQTGASGEGYVTSDEAKVQAQMEQLQQAAEQGSGVAKMVTTMARKTVGYTGNASLEWMIISHVDVEDWLDYNEEWSFSVLAEMAVQDEGSF
jgi:hypothetical protein